MLRKQNNTNSASQTATKKKETPQAVLDIIHFNMDRVQNLFEDEGVLSAVEQISKLELDTMTVVAVGSGYVRRTNAGWAIYTGVVDPTNNEKIFTISGTLYENGQSRFNGKTITVGSHYFSVVEPKLAAIVMLLDRKVNPSDYAMEAESVAASDNNGIQAAINELAMQFAKKEITAQEFRKTMDALTK